LKRRDKRRPLAGLALEIRVSPIKEQLTNRVSRCIFNRRTFFYAPSIIPIRLSNRAAASRTPKHITLHRSKMGALSSRLPLIVHQEAHHVILNCSMCGI
jgi:hypothetical protein